MVQDADLARGYIGAATDTSAVSAHSAGGGRGTLVYQSDTTPVDGTSGTYVGLAPAGALLVAPNGDDEWTLYQNTGTQASPTWTEKAASGGGSGLAYADFQLTDAQIKQLPLTPVTVVAAPGSGLVWEPIGATLVLDSTAGAYVIPIDAPSPPRFVLNRGGTAVLFSASGDPDVTSAALRRSSMQPPQGSSADGLGAGGVGEAMDGADNAPLRLSLNCFDGNSDSQALTGGHADNTLSVRVWYGQSPAVPFGA